MPAKATRKANPLTCRVSTNLDQKLMQSFRIQAEVSGLSDAMYLRRLVENDVGVVRQATPALKRAQLQRAQKDALAHEINLAGLHIRKLGVNVNQLAKQANTGLVPISRAEAVHMMTQIELAMSQTLAALERTLA